MREDAQRRGLSVSEWGIEDVETGEVFRTPRRGRGLPPPRLPADPARAARGQRRARAGARRNELPELVELGDMRGDLHLHSDWSGDGKHSLLDDGRGRARRAGTSTWRSPTTPAGVGMGIGLEPDDVRRQIEAVQLRPRDARRLRRCWPAARSTSWATARSTTRRRCSASSTGSSPRCTSRQRQDSDRITKRLLAAAEHPHVDVIGHPSGRLIGKRDGYDFDVEAVVAACADARHVPRDQLRSRTGSTCARRTRGSRSRRASSS